ncbi:hypothetical protein GCM10022386_07890 [Flavobacterium cheonhonense]|uniref:HNH endonuclease n=1 Tax=Flavobacterium cheonhonense TaxID=706185 RepID=A0ABP7TJE2_9FLAO|nr:hypothetical protein [Flavobacterium cheonhonense]
MISIRECISPSKLKAVRIEHLNFVSAEVEKRIVFYENLFSLLQDLQLYRRTRLITIKNRIASFDRFIHPSQIIPFSRLIFSNPNDFNKTKLNNLKSLARLKIPAQNIPLVLQKLNLLKRRYKSIIDLDLASRSSVAQAYYNQVKIEFTPIAFLLEKIFDYEEWFLKRDSDDVWGPYQLTNALGLKVCCYCNRQYTFTLSKGANKITRPELDHFLPKVINPLLALSFFNLIPSCTICNRDCKGKQPFSYDDYLSPYEKNAKHEFIKYDYFPKSYLGSIGETDEIKVFIKTSGVNSDPLIDTKIKGNIRVFEYDAIINEHKDLVQEIIRKRHISNDSYIETLQKTFPGAHLTLEEAYRLAYGNFYKEEEFGRRPMAKLTKDIAIGVGSLKKHTK